MALIKCLECGNEISDTAKICPHCGYKLKMKKNMGIVKFDFYNINVLSCFLVILSFITSFFEVSFSRDNYSTRRQLLNCSFNYMTYKFVGFEFADIVLGVIAIIALIYVIVRKKLKFKKLYYYIPTFLYNLIELVTSFAVMFGMIDQHTSKYDTYYGILWGGIWILIMLSISSILLIIDLIKDRKKENK